MSYLVGIHRMLPFKRKKTPFIMQMEVVECGAAALAIILGYYGRFVPLTTLRVECGVSRDGSKAANILKAARRYGLAAKGYSKGMDTLKKVSLPCIVFWEFNHFLVVEGIANGMVYLNDPAVGHRELTEEEFSVGYTGVVLTFSPEVGFTKGGRLPSPFPALAERIRGSEKALFFTAMCGLLGVFPAVATAGLMRALVDTVINEGRFEFLRPILVGMLAVLAFQLALTSLSNLFYRRLRRGLSAKLYAEFYRHILRLPYQFYSQRYVGDVVNRAGINDMLVGLIAGQLTSTAIGLVTMVFYGMVLFSYNVPLTLIGIGSTILNFLFIRSVAARRLEANIRIAKEQGKVQGATIAALQSIDSLKASGLEHAFFEKWSGYFTASSNAQQKLVMDSHLFSVLPTLTNTVISTVTLLFGGLMVMDGEMTFGTLMAFNALMGMFLGPVNSLLGLGQQIQQLRGNIIRLEDVTDHPTVDQQRPAQATAGLAPPPVATTIASPSPIVAQNSEHTLGAGDDVSTFTKSRLDGEVECTSIDYGYSPLEAPLIAGLDLRIGSGEMVALVGGSGSGKSTVAKIFAGLILPWSGTVTFDGRLQRDIPPVLLSNSFAMIEQDILLFPGSVRDNLTLWDPTIPEQWLIDALEDADLLDFVLTLPGGLEATVQETGSNMSGGQRQRLEIARALVRKPTFLVMDEATSALDAETEAIIMRNIQRRGCSCLIVAHRLSTIRTCDRIYVLQKGKVKETGTHNELWQAQGLYARLLQVH
jgi:ATP-binding cassette subfamily C protein